MASKTTSQRDSHSAQKVGGQPQKRRRNVRQGGKNRTGCSRSFCGGLVESALPLPLGGRLCAHPALLLLLLLLLDRLHHLRARGFQGGRRRRQAYECLRKLVRVSTCVFANMSGSNRLFLFLSGAGCALTPPSFSSSCFFWIACITCGRRGPKDQHHLVPM